MEFRHTVEKLDAIDAKLTAIEALAPDQPSALASEADALENLHTELTTSMSQTFAKLQKRCQDVDPITQKPIYGETQQKKVTEAYKLYTALLSRVVALRAGPMDMACRQAEAARKAEEMQGEKAQEEAATAQARQQEEVAKAQQEAQAAEARRLAFEANQRAALSSDAARAREDKKRMRKQNEEAAARKWAEARAEDVALVASIPKGVVGAEAGLSLLRGVCGGEATKSYKEAVAALALYVGNVISNPEEATYKRVRLQGVHYRTKVGVHGPGGMRCLVAAGFQMQREEEEEGKDGGREGGARRPSGTGQGSTVIGGDEEEEEKEGGIVLPGARVLVMIEPDMMERQAEWTACRVSSGVLCKVKRHNSEPEDDESEEDISFDSRVVNVLAGADAIFAICGQEQSRSTGTVGAVAPSKRKAAPFSVDQSSATCRSNSSGAKRKGSSSTKCKSSSRSSSIDVNVYKVNDDERDNSEGKYGNEDTAPYPASVEEAARAHGMLALKAVHNSALHRNSSVDLRVNNKKRPKKRPRSLGEGLKIMIGRDEAKGVEGGGDKGKGGRGGGQGRRRRWSGKPLVGVAAAALEGVIIDDDGERGKGQGDKGETWKEDDTGKRDDKKPARRMLDVASNVYGGVYFNKKTKQWEAFLDLPFKWPTVLTDHYYFSNAAAAAAAPDDNGGSDEEEEYPETLALWPAILAITSSTTTSPEHEAESLGEEGRALAWKRMQKLLLTLENSSVNRFRMDRDPRTGQTTYDKGRSVVQMALTAHATTPDKRTPTTARRIACYLHWHIFTKDEPKQRRVRIFGNNEALAAIFLVKKGALDTED
ncbi:hypothetical protein VYU27_005337 [Nannochloropsis oceanica]